MRDAFIDFGKLMKSALFRDRLKTVFGKENQTLYSRRIEDEIYQEVREGRDGMLSELEKQAQGKLPGIGDLSRDVFQSLFSTNVKEKPEEQLSPTAKKFHRPILRQLNGCSPLPTRPCGPSARETSCPPTMRRRSSCARSAKIWTG